jgi:ribonuclease E
MQTQSNSPGTGSDSEQLSEIGRQKMNTPVGMEDGARSPRQGIVNSGDQDQLVNGADETETDTLFKDDDMDENPGDEEDELEEEDLDQDEEDSEITEDEADDDNSEEDTPSMSSF